jgi:hypothetical protein
VHPEATAPTCTLAVFVEGGVGVGAGVMFSEGSVLTHVSCEALSVVAAGNVPIRLRRKRGGYFRAYEETSTSKIRLRIPVAI